MITIRTPIFDSLRWRLTLILVLFMTVLFGFVIADLVYRERTTSYRQLGSEGQILSRNLASNAATWLIIDDVSGLDELTNGLKQIPYLKLAMVLDIEGRVRGSTDSTLFNLVLDDPISRHLLGESPADRQQWHDGVMDSISPISRMGNTIGYARIILGDEHIQKELNQIQQRAVAYLLIVILLAGFAIWFFVRKVTSRLGRLSAAASSLASGEMIELHEEGGYDEVSHLTRDFNQMAQSILSAKTNLEARIAEATRELRERNEEISRTADSKSRFLAAASHDLRQPLHALGLFVTRLSKMQRGKDAIELARNVERSVTVLQEMLNTLLDVSRIDAGLVKPKKKDIPVSELLERLSEVFSGPAQERSLTFTIRPSSLAIHADPILTELVLANFVSNAIRYTGKGGILVACRRRGEYVRIQVWDTGKGIPQESLDVIFAEYVQLSNPERDRTKGLGLGLSICRRIGNLTGNRIGVSSRVGRGSIFWIDVPIATSATSAVEPPLQLETIKDFTGTVAIIEDDDLVRAGMIDLLLSWGFTVHASTNYRGIMERLTAAVAIPDILLCDFRLGGQLTGIDSAEMVRAKYGSVPVIIISGDSGDELKTLAAQHGFKLLHKPLRPARLRANMNLLLEEANGRKAA